MFDFVIFLWFAIPLLSSDIIGLLLSEMFVVCIAGEKIEKNDDVVRAVIAVL